jgi:hypothetical protein
MPRLLKEPEGCRVSSLRKILLLQFSDLRLVRELMLQRKERVDCWAPYHPAASERLADSTRGVSRHGFLSLVAGLMAGCLTAGALELALLVRGA